MLEDLRRACWTCAIVSVLASVGKSYSTCTLVLQLSLVDRLVLVHIRPPQQPLPSALCPLPIP